MFNNLCKRKTLEQTNPLLTLKIAKVNEKWIKSEYSKCVWKAQKITITKKIQKIKLSEQNKTKQIL